MFEKMLFNKGDGILIKNLCLPRSCWTIFQVQVGKSEVSNDTYCQWLKYKFKVRGSPVCLPFGIRPGAGSNFLEMYCAVLKQLNNTLLQCERRPYCIRGVSNSLDTEINI